MKKIISLALVLATSTLLSASDDIEMLVDKKCGMCHLSGTLTKEKVKNIKAPPYWGMSRKVREAFDTQEERVNFIVDYTLNPSEDKMLFPPATKKRFGLMPSQKGKVTEEEIRRIAEHFLGD